jgi:hypothetical protein
MQREHVGSQSRSGGQRERIPVGRTQNPMPARVMTVTVGSDAADPDAAVRVARSSHDLAAKPDSFGGMHLRINPQGNRRGPPHSP